MKIDFVSSMIALGVFLAFILVLFWQFKTKNLTSAIFFPNVSQFKSAGKSWRANFRWVLIVLRLSAIILLLIAFMRPQKGLEVIKTSKQGIAIQMVLDRSSSMNEPLRYKRQEYTRIDVVKQVFEEFILGNEQELKGRTNDMIGLISFAGFVEENSPLTLDHKSLVSFAKTIKTAERIEDGTMIGDAIYYSVLKLISVDELLKKGEQGSNDYKIKSKIIILLTDGQQTQGGMEPIKAAEFARENDIKLYTIAITSEDSPNKNSSLFGQFFSMRNRQIDTSMIQKAAEITGGQFLKASSFQKLIEVYKQIDDLEKSNFTERFTKYKEQFAFFVMWGLLLLFVEITLRNTLFRKIP